MSDVPFNAHCEAENGTRIAAQVEMKRAGRRKLVYHGGTLCSKCLTVPPGSGDQYCRPCRAKYVAARRAAVRAQVPDNG